MLLNNFLFALAVIVQLSSVAVLFALHDKLPTYRQAARVVSHPILSVALSLLAASLVGRLYGGDTAIGLTPFLLVLITSAQVLIAVLLHINQI